MRKFYLKTHARIFSTMRVFCLLVLATILSNISIQAQCSNPTSFGSGTAPTSPGVSVTLTTCAFAGEYSTINTVPAATPFIVTGTGGTGNFITIRQGTPGGTVIAFGVSPLSWNSTVAGTYYAHVNTNAACGTDATCHTLTVTNNLPLPDPCASVLPLTCLTPTTATLVGAGGGWSPGSCGFSTPGAEQVYSYTPALSGMHTLNVTAATGGFVDYFFKDATGGCSSTGWTCIDDISSPASATFGPLTAGTQYYILVDAEGTASRTHTFSITCPTPCTVTCPANITVSNDPGTCGAVVNYPPATTSGTCGTLTYSTPSGSFFPRGTTTVTVTSSIGGGTCSFTVTVNDTQVPTITCPGNVTVNATAGQCSAVVTFAAGTAADNCPGVTVTSSPASGSAFPVGTTTVTQTATDASGNTATCTFTVTVVDTQAPVITCPSNITVGNDLNQCGAVVNFTVGSTDNCASATLTQSTSNTVTALNSISCNAGGLHAENSYWRAYQLALPAPVAVNSVTFGIETANAAGVGTTQPVNVRVYTSAGAFPGGVRTQVASQTFNIPDQSNTLFTASFTTPPTVPGNAILVLEVNTPDGQAAGHSFFIGTNSAGQSAPSYISATACGLTSPGTLASVGFPNVHIILNASVSGSVPVVSVPASGSVFPVGTTTVTSTATDAAGNTASCSFTVTVNDTQAPAITCPANVTRTTDVGVCTATFAPNNPTATDNCAVTVQTWALTGATVASSPATGINTVGSRAFNLGVTTVTYTVRDAAGNSTSCSFTVTITDALLPTITAQPVNRTVCAGTTATFSVTAVTAPTAGGPLAYQWQQWNGTAWVNAAGVSTGSTYSVAGTTQSMNTNTFRVVITGLCSVVNSSAATLFVNALPTISLSSSINSPVLIPGQVTNIIANVNPTGGTFAWFKNGAPRVPTVTTGTLSNLTVDDAGTYRATYTDPNGCVATSADLVISAEVTDRLFVAPNPNFGQFWVRYYNQTGESLTVVVFDSKGRRVHQQQSATGLAYTRIDVDMGIQAAGIYVVELRGTGGRLLGRKQMIVAQR